MRCTGLSCGSHAKNDCLADHVSVRACSCVFAGARVDVGQRWKEGEFTSFPSQTVPNDYTSLLGILGA